MKKLCSIFVVLCLISCLLFTACGQANSVPETTPAPTEDLTAEPTPNSIDYEALAAKLNGDIISPLDEVEAKLEETETNNETGSPSDDTASKPDNAAPEAEIDAEKIQNALISGGIFEAGDDCVIYRFWSAGIDKELFDLLGSDGTESSAAVYSELLKTFVANYDALQKAVALYEPEAVLVLHVVENSEATNPIIVVKNCEVTYDYATEQGYFVNEEADLVEEAYAGETVG